MEYLAQASDGLSSHSTMRMKRECVTQTGETHNIISLLRWVCVQLWVQVHLYQNMRLSRSKDDIIELQAHIISKEMA